MTLQLFYNKSEKIKVGKNLENKGTKTGTLKEGTSIVNPVVRVKQYSHAYSANYFYIPEFSRYYYITDVKVVNGGIFEISGHVDVLQSFADAIRNAQGYIKATKTGNLYYQDNNFPVSSDSIVVVKTFDNEPFGGTSIIMPLSSSHVE